MATKQTHVSGDDFGRFLRAAKGNETQKVLFFLRKMAISRCKFHVSLKIPLQKSRKKKDQKQRPSQGVTKFITHENEIFPH